MGREPGQAGSPCCAATPGQNCFASMPLLAPTQAQAYACASIRLAALHINQSYPAHLVPWMTTGSSNLAGVAERLLSAHAMRGFKRGHTAMIGRSAAAAKMIFDEMRLKGEKGARIKIWPS
ncbi:hypothetical protein CI102_5325 [Trichoderma harzianum]|nr:hypothetical protein CI102_5325 [Trichoderma harzianum]